MALRIIFMGTPEFAVASLDKLWQNGCNIVAVVTAPDKPAGRGQKIQSTAVKQYAEEKKLPILQPVSLKDSEFINTLKEINPDLIVVVAFRMLPEIVWSMPRFGTLNLHASLLPQYRGAAPINWAIINGEKETGVTTFFIEKEIDTGNIIFQEEVEIDPKENAGDLHDKLMNTGADLLLRTVKSIETGKYPKIPQSILRTDDLKPAPKIHKETCRIQWNNSTNDIYNFIRGLSPYPGAFTEISDKNGNTFSLKIFDVELSNSSPETNPGNLITDKKSFLQVKTADGVLNIKSLQLEGKKKLKTEEFLRGFQNIESYTAN